MFKAIGTVIILYTVVHLFGTATASFEKALIATFDAITVVVSAGADSVEKLETN